MPFTNFEDVKAGYAALWNTVSVRADKKNAAQGHARAILAAKARYESIEARTGVPWWWVGIVHTLESNRNFATHLHNGDALRNGSGKAIATTHVPKGRGPFETWEDSAVDALLLKNLKEVPAWTFPRALWEFERYNGFGYTSRGINSPYVWSYTNLYTQGKYVADGEYSATAVSGQCGCAAILKELITMGALAPATPEPEKEKIHMSTIDDILGLLKPIAPVIATALGGPLAGVAVKALADELKCDAQSGAVATAVQATPLATLVPILQTVESVLLSIQQPAQAPTPAAVVPATPQSGTVTVVQTPATNGVIVDSTANVIKTVVAGVLFILASLFIKDAAMAHSIADMVSPIITTLLTGVGGGLMVWLQNRSVTASNTATLTALASR